MPVHTAESASSQSGSASNTAPALVIGSLEIDLWNGRASLSRTPNRLSKIEFRVLVHLGHNAGRPVPTAELLHTVWNVDELSPGAANMLRGCIKRLRAKIEFDTLHPQTVLTVYGYGYMIPAQRA